MSRTIFEGTTPQVPRFKTLDPRGLVAGEPKFEKALLMQTYVWNLWMHEWSWIHEPAVSCLNIMAVPLAHLSKQLQWLCHLLQNRGRLPGPTPSKHIPEKHSGQTSLPWDCHEMQESSLEQHQTTVPGAAERQHTIYPIQFRIQMEW